MNAGHSFRCDDHPQATHHRETGQRPNIGQAMPTLYEIHVLGEIDDSTAQEFGDLLLTANHDEMLLRANWTRRPTRLFWSAIRGPRSRTARRARIRPAALGCGGDVDQALG